MQPCIQYNSDPKFTKIYKSLLKFTMVIWKVQKNTTNISLLQKFWVSSDTM